MNEGEYRSTAEESGWSKVKSFLKEKDEKLYFFAINQLRRRLEIPLEKLKKVKRRLSNNDLKNK